MRHPPRGHSGTGAAGQWVQMTPKQSGARWGWGPEEAREWGLCFSLGVQGVPGGWVCSDYTGTLRIELFWNGGAWAPVSPGGQGSCQDRVACCVSV